MSETALATQEKATKAPLAMKDGMVHFQSMEDAYRFATAVVKSGMFQGFKTPEQVMIAVQMGAEVGMKPTQACQNIAVINGRPALWGKGLSGVVLRSGLMEDFKEWTEGTGDDMVAVCAVRRKGIAEERVSRFSVADAKKAGLWGRNTWASYPKDMLAHKARARAFKLFDDILCGLPIVEDVREAYEAPQLKEPPKQADPLLKQIGVAEIVKPEPQEETLEFEGEIPESNE